MNIFINPGHDVLKDPGAVNPVSGLKEADVVKEIGDRVSHYLQIVGYHVLLMQDDNLSWVVNRANNVSDVFVSIHCNAFNTQARGTETFAYSFSSSGGNLARCVHNELYKTLGGIDPSLPNRGVKEGKSLYVLRATNMPAILVEVAFIDNEQDVKLLENNIEDISRAIARGITDYFVKFA